MQNKKILVCDDDSGILDVVSIILNHNNFNVIAEINSTHAMTKILAEKPDLIVLDLWMPILNGGELAKMIRENDVTKDIPIIIFTASNEGKNLLTTLPVNDYVAKPFDLNELVDTVKRNINAL